MKSIVNHTRHILPAVLAGAMAVGLLTPVAAADQSGLAVLRNATAAFHSIDAAQAAGYTVQVYDLAGITCITDPGGAGTMGIHFLNPDLLGTVDPSEPQLLIYVPRNDGTLKLVGVEFLMLADGWDATHSGPPSLFGQDYTKVLSPNRYGLPDFYELHVWVWHPNPNGMFDEWNPTLSC